MNIFYRLADVIPRGFSGYNTRWCKLMLPDILDSVNTTSISCVTIFLGANDCTLPVSTQHVPVVEYQQNLEAMVDTFQSRGIDRQKIIFIAPPTYFHSDFEAASIIEGEPAPLRSGDLQSVYAKAMIDVGGRLNVSVVDAYSAFAADGRGERLFSDGLHFSTAGSDLLCELILKEVETRVLAYRGETLANETMNYPKWRDIDVDNLEGSILQQNT